MSALTRCILKLKKALLRATQISRKETIQFAKEYERRVV